MVKKITIKLIQFITIVIIFPACGESALDLGVETFEQKIVVEGFLYPEKIVEGIKLTRNFPLNTKPNPVTLIIQNADVRIVDLQLNKEFNLSFNFKKLSYEYSGSDLSINYDKVYKLIVNASIDGKVYSLSSVTKTPKKGFRINRSKTISGIISYHERDQDGNVKELPLVFYMSEGTTYYPISIVALNASDTTFIYENAFREVKQEDVIKNLDNYKYQKRWLQNLSPTGTTAKYDINWLSIWFYGNYRMIVYAGDENFRLFSQTNGNVQEFDGNFHEPKINIQGDGIGVFGSVIADTVYFQVKK